MKPIDIDALELLPALQMRTKEPDPGLIAEYAEVYADLPPVEVVQVGKRFIVTDGWHRVLAHQAANRGFVPCIIVANDDLDGAVWRAIGANKGHGLRRTNADKRRAVLAAISHPYAGDLSLRDIAEHCGVSHTYVADLKAEAAPKPAEVSTVDTIIRDTTAEPQAKPSARATSRKAPKPAPPLIDTEQAEVTLVLGNLSGKLAATRRDIGEQAGHPSPVVSEVVRAIDDALGVCLAHCRQNAPVDCPKHTGDGCHACGGKGWTTAQHAKVMTRGAK